MGKPDLDAAGNGRVFGPRKRETVLRLLRGEDLDLREADEGSNGALLTTDRDLQMRRANSPCVNTWK